MPVSGVDVGHTSDDLIEFGSCGVEFVGGSSFVFIPAYEFPLDEIVEMQGGGIGGSVENTRHFLEAPAPVAFPAQQQQRLELAYRVDVGRNKASYIRRYIGQSPSPLDWCC